MRQLSRIATWIALAALVVGLTMPALANSENGEAELIGPKVKRSTQIDPYYPATAMNQTPAMVTLLATVEANGKVGNLEVVGCDNPDLGFEQAAVDAVRHWKFKPGLKDGEAVAMDTYLLLEFQAPRFKSTEESTLARTLVAPAFQLETMPDFAGSMPSTSGPTGNSTAAVTTPGPISISALFPKRKGQDLIDKTEFNPVQRQVVGLPGGGGRRGGGPTAQGRH